MANMKKSFLVEFDDDVWLAIEKGAERYQMTISEYFNETYREAERQLAEAKEMRARLTDLSGAAAGLAQQLRDIKIRIHDDRPKPERSNYT